jgi:hypothetical protein
MFKWFIKKQKQPSSPETVWYLLNTWGQSTDFQKQTFTNLTSNQHFWISFIISLVDSEIVQKIILPYLLHSPIKTLDDIKQMVPVEDIIITSNVNVVEEKMHEGYLLVQLNEFANEAALIKAQRSVIRSISIPEVEFSVVGPKESFIESLETNLHLLRKRIPSNSLTIKIFKIGKLSKTKIAVIYNPTHSQTEVLKLYYMEIS